MCWAESMEEAVAWQMTMLLCCSCPDCLYFGHNEALGALGPPPSSHRRTRTLDLTQSAASSTSTASSSFILTGPQGSMWEWVWKASTSHSSALLLVW